MPPVPPIVLSHFQVEPVLAARRQGAADAPISPDLGLSRVRAELRDDGVLFPGGELLPWLEVEEIIAAPQSCFAVTAEGVRRLQLFSEATQRVISLMPTAAAPTMVLAGFPMHRIKDTDPHQDTLHKLSALKPVRGRVLDTAMGLGYTAIEAARTADEVVTIELDPGVVELASWNPWSRELFTNPRIRRIEGDSSEVVGGMEDQSFTCILHDPPIFSLAGDLYGGAFYRELYRLLRRGGRLFHYIGDLDSGSTRRVLPGIQRRLKEAGFTKIVRKPEAFGLLAYR